MFRINYILGGDRAYRDRCMRILLATLTLVDREYLRDHPEAIHPLKLKYAEEAPGVDEWVDASALQTLKACDCEDAAAYTAAWLYVHHGIDAWPQIVEDEDGCSHVIVELPNGQKYDPTLKIGRPDVTPHACTGLHKNDPEETITFVTDLFRTRSSFIGFEGSPISQRLAHKSLSLMLHALFAIDVHYLNHHDAPPLYGAGVVYAEEPPGREDWQDIPSSIRRRNGDCEDLATWRAAEIAVRLGLNAYPSFIWKMRPTGAYLYHIQTTWPDGRVEDPSRRLGMGAHQE